MVREFTAESWARLHEFVREFEAAPMPSSSPERRRLRSAMRRLGFYASEFGLRNTTRADLAALRREGLLRVR